MTKPSPTLAEDLVSTDPATASTALVEFTAFCEEHATLSTVTDRTPEQKARFEELTADLAVVQKDWPTLESTDAGLEPL